jgi:peptidoglycan/LPS O-acetylase OafA/YrhL
MMGNVPPPWRFLNQRRLQMEKKILGVLPKSTVNVLFAALVVTYVLALIWSWVEAQSFSADHYWVKIIEMLLLAVIIGGVVGWLANNTRRSTLWIAAGFAWLGTLLVEGLIANAPGGVDGATLASLGGEAFSTTVSAGAIVIGIVAAYAAAMAARETE